MDFSLEEAMEFLFELILSAQLIGISVYFLANCDKFM